MREATRSRVLSARLQDGVLFGGTGVEFANLTGGSAANRRPKPVFATCRQHRGLGFA
jgi:hypothetical protein